MQSKEIVPLQEQRPDLPSLKRLFVPLDGSRCAEEALVIAARIARASGATVTLARTFPQSPKYDISPLEPASIQKDLYGQELHEAGCYLQRIAVSDVLDGIGVHTELLIGHSVEALVECAKQQPADLIVMCSHGHIGMPHWMYGSVAQQMLRLSPIPTLVVRKGTSSAFLAQAERGRPFPLLVALDGSILSATALLPAAWLTTVLSAPLAGKLHLMRVVSPTAANVEECEEVRQRMDAQKVKQAEEYLVSIVSLLKTGELSQLHLDVTMEIALESEVTRTLLQATDPDRLAPVHSGYDAIALATYGRHGLPHWVAGSVAEQLLGVTHLPLLVVSHPEPAEILFQ